MERIKIICPKCKKTEIIEVTPFNKLAFIECRKCGFMFQVSENKETLSKV